MGLKLTARFVLIAFLVSLPLSSALAQNDDMHARAEAAVKATSDSFKFFYVPSSGAVADETFITVSRTRGPAAIAKQLARVFRDADKKPLTLAVSGPSEGKTVQVIRDAIKLTKKTLPQLKLIYVGGVDAAREVETAVKEAGGSFVHAPF